MLFLTSISAAILAATGPIRAAIVPVAPIGTSTSCVVPAASQAFQRADTKTGGNFS